MNFSLTVNDEIIEAIDYLEWSRVITRTLASGSLMGNLGADKTITCFS